MNDDAKPLKSGSSAARQPSHANVDRLIDLASDKNRAELSRTDPDAAEQPKDKSMWKILLQLRPFLPYIARMVPVLDVALGPLQHAGLSHEVRESIAQSTAKIQSIQRDLSAAVISAVEVQAVQLKRLEEEVTRLRETAEIQARAQALLVEDLRSLGRLFRFAMIGGAIGLVALIAMSAILLMQAAALRPVSLDLTAEPLFCELDRQYLTSNRLIGNFGVFHKRLHSLHRLARIEVVTGLEISGRIFDFVDVVTVERRFPSSHIDVQRNNRRVGALNVAQDAARRVMRSGWRFSWMLQACRRRLFPYAYHSPRDATSNRRGLNGSFRTCLPPRRFVLLESVALALEHRGFARILGHFRCGIQHPHRIFRLIPFHKNVGAVDSVTDIARIEYDSLYVEDVGLSQLDMP